MKFFKFISFFLLILNIFVFPCRGESVLSITDGKNLQLRLNGHIIITDGVDWAGEDSLTITKGTSTQLINEKDATLKMETKLEQGFVSGGALPFDVCWAREAASNGRRAEITFAAIAKPADRSQKMTWFRYNIMIPCKVLKGANYEARIGRRRRLRPLKNGIFTGKEKEGKYLLLGIRHITFWGGMVDFTLDFSPSGVWGLYVDDLTSVYKAHLFRKGDYYVFSLATRNARFGAKISSKVVVRAGRHDNDRIHEVTYVHYASPIPALKRIQFTDRKAVTGFVSQANVPGLNVDFLGWALKPFDSSSGVGWDKLPSNTKIFHNEKGKSLGPIFDSGVTGKGKAIFRIKHPDAWVLANILLSGQNGSCDVKIKTGKEAVRHERVEEGERRTIIIPAKVTNGELDISLDGPKWMLSGIIIQLLMQKEEDYIFDRTWWVFGKEPWMLDKFKGKQNWKLWPKDSFNCNKWAKVSIGKSGVSNKPK